jgi:hypothetical protein
MSYAMYRYKTPPSYRLVEVPRGRGDVIGSERKREGERKKKEEKN